MNYQRTDHTFAICAYKESSFLEECINSLLNQTVKSNIILATSTPNEHIESLCQKYNIQLFINKGEAGIAGDWNFATSCCNTPIITIAHQDDIYEPEYCEQMLKNFNSNENTIISFSDYAELRNDSKVTNTQLLRIKRFLLFPLRIFKKSIFIRRRVLSLGCSICCPAVTYNADILKDNPFKSGYKSDLDWQQWEKLSKIKGRFIYTPSPLMCHRIHEESETSHIIGENTRTKEDYEMFKKFWPDFIAKVLTRLYSNSEKSNIL